MQRFWMLHNETIWNSTISRLFAYFGMQWLYFVPELKKYENNNNKQNKTTQKVSNAKLKY